MSTRIGFLVAASLALVALVAGAALGQQALDLRLLDASLAEDGTTTLLVSVTGDVVNGDEPIPAAAFSVVEDGQVIEGLEVEPIVEVEDRPESTIVVLFDISGSAAGEPIAAAIDAAIAFAQMVMPDGVRVGLVPFSTDAEVALAPTDDLAAVTGAIAGLEAGGNTALYDAIVLGSQVLAGFEGERTLVLFTDGADTSSEATLDEAVAAAVAAEAPIVNVALITPDQDPEVLDALAVRSDGVLLAVEELDQLSDAFAQVAMTLTSQYVVRYTSSVIGDELDLTLAVEVGGERAELAAVLINPRLEVAQPEALPPPPPAQLFDPGPLGSDAALIAALATGFVALVLIALMLVYPRGDRAAERTLRRGVTMVQRGESRAPRAEGGLTASSIGRAAVDLVSRAPKPEGYDDRLQTEIDRAGWQLRASEFSTMRVGAAIGGFALLWALSGRLWLGLLGLVAGAAAPMVVLANSKARRKARFMQQLPDALQLLSGTLKAGYGVLQAIDTVVKEVEDPMASEFQRALTEARLGLPLEDSLDAMADRVDSEDFRWVVVAMNIQRAVGGNLAELLETVSETLRGRDQVRRQIKVLSAEGRLSAIVLVALPFVLLGYLLVVNPTYLAPLMTNVIGWILAGGAAFLMVVGIFWMRKLIQIDV